MVITKEQMQDAGRELGKGTLSEAFSASFKASPVPGMDLDTYMKHVMRAQSGDTAAMAVIGYRIQSGLQGTNNEKEGKKDSNSFLWWVLQQQELLRLQLEQIEADIQEYNRKIIEIESHMQGIDEVHAHFLETGEIEVDENGHLKNTDADNALAAYEERTGQKIDRNNPHALDRALQQQKFWENAERICLEIERAKAIELKKQKEEEISQFDAEVEKINDIEDPHEKTLAIENLPKNQKEDLFSGSKADTATQKTAAKILKIDLQEQDDDSAAFSSSTSKTAFDQAANPSQKTEQTAEAERKTDVNNPALKLNG